MASNHGSAMAAPTPWSRVLRDNVPSAMVEKELQVLAEERLVWPERLLTSKTVGYASHQPQVVATATRSRDRAVEILESDGGAGFVGDLG
jgi:hypothetical protein